jgi:hypothetical protein
VPSACMSLFFRAGNCPLDRSAIFVFISILPFSPS